MWIWWASWALAAPRCGTPDLRAQPAPMGFAASYRPSAVGYVDSSVYPLRVHYRRPSDADRVANVIVPALETAWAVQIDQVGWPAPPPDGGAGGSDAYDVYVTNDGTNGGAWVWGFGPDVVPDDGWYTVPSFMALDENIPDADMVPWVAHELNHASQYTIDAWESSTFVWEAVAETMAEVTDDQANLYIPYGAMPDFQEFPFLSLVFDGYRPQVAAVDPWSYYEYGGIIFGMFLEERYGTNDGRTVLALWEALAQPSDRPQPDFLDALDTLAPDTDRADIYIEFAVWRMFTGTWDVGEHLEEANLWGEREQVGVDATLPLAGLDGLRVNPAEAPYDLGTSYFVVPLRGESDDELIVTLDADPTAVWGLVWAVWDADGTARTGQVRSDDGKATVRIPLAGGDRLQIGVANAGPHDMDAAFDVPRREFELRFARETPPATTLPDTGGLTETTGTDTATADTALPAVSDFQPRRPRAQAPAGCGCAAHESSTPSPRWWMRRRP